MRPWAILSQDNRPLPASAVAEVSDEVPLDPASYQTLYQRLVDPAGDDSEAPWTLAQQRSRWLREPQESQ